MSLNLWRALSGFERLTMSLAEVNICQHEIVRRHLSEGNPAFNVVRFEVKSGRNEDFSTEHLQQSGTIARRPIIVTTKI
jgi:hypothetical protein